MLENMDKGKIFSFILFFAYIMGSIGGVGYAIYCKAYVIAVAVIILAAMAFPAFKKHWNNLFG
jgi:hypothetical protein